MANTFKFGNGEWAVGKETALAYNDENSNFKPLPFTFDRASTATVVNKQGLIETVGIDEPRIDFLNNTKGHLLLEPSRQNVITYSEDFSDSSWTKVNTTITSNNTTSPDGTINATLCDYGSGSYINTGFASTGDTDVTVSVFAKADSVSSLRIRESFYIGSSCVYDLNLGTASAGGTIDNYGNGWYRCSFTYNLAAGQTNVNFIFDSNTQIGSLFLWGATCELASYATSYIPTQGSAVTRSAETCNSAGNLNVINSTEGTLFLEVEKQSGDNTKKRITLNNGSSSVFINIEHTVSNNIKAELYDGSNVSGTITSATLTQDNNKIAYTYKVNEFKLFINGTQSGSTVTTGGTLSSGTLKNISLDNGSGVDVFKGIVKDIKVYNTALTDAELIQLTS